MSALHQVVSTLEPDDAVGNEVRLIASGLRDAGLDSRVFVAHRTGREPAAVDSLDELPDAPVLYHFATASQATEALCRSSRPLALVYHGVTPPDFFWGVDRAHHDACLAAAAELDLLRDRAGLALAHSEFTRAELARRGFAGTASFPLLLELPPGDPAPSPAAPHVLLTVGRIAPNKCIEDAVRLLHALRHTGCDAELWIAGDGSRVPAYTAALHGLVDRLALSGAVRWLGRLPRSELDRCYRRAAVYVSMSEHEGFGGPLVEAMHAGLPVLAHDAGAVAETLGGAGVLLPAKDAALAAEAVLAVLDGGPTWEELARAGRRRAAELRPEPGLAALLDHLRRAAMVPA